jgi:hypothetical protein
MIFPAINMQLHVVLNNPRGIKWFNLQYKFFPSLATRPSDNIKMDLNQVVYK